MGGVATQLTSELEMSGMELAAGVGRSLGQSLLRVLRFDLPIVQPDWRWPQRLVTPSVDDKINLKILASL